MNDTDKTLAELDAEYNGWTNYATWGVALVLDNDEGTYNEVRERAESLLAYDHPNVPEIWTADEAARFGLADFLKDYVEDLCGLEDDPGPTLMACQVLQAGLGDVDWDEIARVILSER